MSLFVKVSRFGSEDRLFYFRELVIGLSESPRGIQASDSNENRLLTLGVVGDRIVVQAETASVRVGDIPIERGTQQVVPSETELIVGDYHISLFVTQPGSEMAARLNLNSPEELKGKLNQPSMPKLSYRLAQWSREYPLLQGMEMTLGSSINDALYVDVPGVNPQHATVSYDGSKVTLRSRFGSLILDGGGPTKEISIGTSQAVKLEPPGIDLLVTFP